MVATAIHAGHGLRRSIAALTALDDATRLREEDPFTDRLAAVGGTTVMVHRLAVRGGPQPPAGSVGVPGSRRRLGARPLAGAVAGGRRGTVPAAVRRLLLGAGAAAGRGGGAWAVRRVGPALLQPPPGWRRRAPGASEPESGGQRRDRFGRPGSLGWSRRPVHGRPGAPEGRRSPPRRAGERPLHGRGSSVAGSIRAVQRHAGVRSRSSSRSCSWTSGAAASTNTISTSSGTPLAAVVPAMTDELRCPASR